MIIVSVFASGIKPCISACAHTEPKATRIYAYFLSILSCMQNPNMRFCIHKYYTL